MKIKINNILLFIALFLIIHGCKGQEKSVKNGWYYNKVYNTFFKDKDIELEIRKHLIPDDPVLLEKLLLEARDTGVSVIFTTGGTGIGPRDYTPDVVKKLLDKEIPGIMEMIRVKYGMVKPNALISRGIAGTLGNSLVYTLPGSLRAVAEYCSEILPTIIHSIKMVQGIDDHS